MSEEQITLTEKPMNIYQKMLEVKKVVRYLQKAADGPQYQYVSSGQVLSAVTDKMNEVGLFLEVEIKDHKVTSREKATRNGTNMEYFTELDLIYTWVNADNPEEKIVKPWYGQGIDTAGEKGVGKALTYAEKYFLLKWFNIATDKDDPDAFQEKVDASKPTPKLNAEQVGTLKTLVQLVASYGGTEAQVMQALRKKFGFTGEMSNLTVDAFEPVYNQLVAWKQAKEATAVEAKPEPDPENFRETVEAQEQKATPVDAGQFDSLMESLLKYGGTEAAIRGAIQVRLKKEDIEVSRDFNFAELPVDTQSIVIEQMTKWLADRAKK